MNLLHHYLIPLLRIAILLRSFHVSESFLKKRLLKRTPFGLSKAQLYHHVPRGGSTTEAAAPVTPEVQSNVTFSGEDEWRNEFPEQLRKREGSLYRFLIPTGFPAADGQSDHLCEVYILGTAHVSKDSCDDVKTLMKHVKPDVLFIELCNQRIAILENGSETLDEVVDCKKEKSVGEMTKELMQHNPGMNKAAALSSVLLTKIQSDYATKLNVTIGGEFKEAYQMAKSQHLEMINLVKTIQLQQSQGILNDDLIQKARMCNGCSIVLGDRPVRLTLLRAWEALSPFGKIKLIFALVWSSFFQPSEEELKEWIDSVMNDPTNDILSKSIQELSRHFPAIQKTIIEERDMYMACKIVQTVRIIGAGSSQDGMRRKIVAIVGAGHCPGIKSLLSREVNRQGELKVEEELVRIVQTKRHTIENDPEMNSLITDVASIKPILPP
jgi:pheromone shutdown protein TraB